MGVRARARSRVRIHSRSSSPKQIICDCLDEAIKLTINLTNMKKDVEHIRRVSEADRDFALRRARILGARGCIESVVVDTIQGAIKPKVPSRFDLEAAISDLWSSSYRRCKELVRV